MTEITIKMVYNGKEIEASSRILTAYGEGVLVTPITVEGGVVDMCSNGSFKYQDPLTGEAHSFILSSIARTDFNGGTFHVLTGKEDQIIEKKRKAERYMVQQMGLAVINKKINTNMMVNDISLRGISLLVNNENLVKVGDSIKVTFFIGGGRRLTVECRVVRIFKIQNINAAGCVFKSVSTDLISYVQDKKAEYNQKMNVKVAG